MNIRVLALSLLLFWGIVAPAFANDETITEAKAIHVKGEGENDNSVVPSLQRATPRPSNDGGRKNIGAIVDDLTTQNVQPAQEASSGTDWGGLNSSSKSEKESTDKKTSLREKRAISSNTNAMRKVMKSGQATVAETLNGGAAIQRILAQAEAETNKVRADLYKKKFRSNLFKNDFDDWVSLGSGRDIFGNVFNTPHRSRLRPHVRPANSYYKSPIFYDDFGGSNEFDSENDERENFEIVNVGRRGYHRANRNFGRANFNRQGQPYNRPRHRPHFYDYRNNNGYRGRFEPMIWKDSAERSRYNRAHRNKESVEANRIQNEHSSTKEATGGEVQHDLMAESTNIKNMKTMAHTDRKNSVNYGWSANENHKVDTLSSSFNDDINVRNTAFARSKSKQRQRTNMPSFARKEINDGENKQWRNWNAFDPKRNEIADNGNSGAQERWVSFKNGRQWNNRGGTAGDAIWQVEDRTVLANDQKNDDAKKEWRLRQNGVEHGKIRRLDKTNTNDVVFVGAEGEGYASKSLENPSASVQVIASTNTNVGLGKHTGAAETSSHAQAAENIYNDAAEHIEYARANYHEHSAAKSTSAVNGRMVDDAHQRYGPVGIAKNGKSAIYQNHNDVIGNFRKRNKKGRNRDMVDKHLSEGGIVLNTPRRNFNTKFKHLFSNGELTTADDDEESSSEEGPPSFFNFFADDMNRPQHRYKIKRRRPPDSTEKDIEFNWTSDESSSTELISYMDIYPEYDSDDSEFVVIVPDHPGKKLRNRDKVTNRRAFLRRRQELEQNDQSVRRSDSKVKSRFSLDNKDKIGGKVTSRGRGNYRLIDDAPANWKESDTGDFDIVTQRRTADTNAEGFQKNHLGQDINVNNTGRRRTSKVLNVSSADIASTTAAVKSFEERKQEKFRTDNAERIHQSEEVFDVNFIENARDGVNNDETYYLEDVAVEGSRDPFRKYHRVSQLPNNQWKELSIEEDIETGASNIDVIQTTLVLDDPDEMVTATSSTTEQTRTKGSLELQSNEIDGNTMEKRDEQIRSEGIAMRLEKGIEHTRNSGEISKVKTGTHEAQTTALMNNEYVSSDTAGEEEIDKTLLTMESYESDVASAVVDRSSSSENKDAWTFTAAKYASEEMGKNERLDKSAEVLDNGTGGLGLSRSSQSRVLSTALDENTSQVEEAVKTIIESGIESSKEGSLDKSIVHGYIGERAKTSHRQEHRENIDDGIYREDMEVQTVEEALDKSVRRASMTEVQSSGESQETGENSSLSVITKAAVALKDDDTENGINEERSDALSAEIVFFESSTSAASNLQIERDAALTNEISLASSSAELSAAGLDSYDATNTRRAASSRKHLIRDDQHRYQDERSGNDGWSESGEFTTKSMAVLKSDTSKVQERGSVSAETFIGAENVETEKDVLTTHRRDESINEISTNTKATNTVDNTIDSESSTSLYETERQSNEDDGMRKENTENGKIDIEGGKLFSESIKKSHTREGYKSEAQEESVENVARSVGSSAVVNVMSAEGSIENSAADSVETSREYHAKRNKVIGTEKNNEDIVKGEIINLEEEDMNSIELHGASSHSNKERKYEKNTGHVRTGEKSIGRSIAALASNKENNSLRQTEATASAVAEAEVYRTEHKRGLHERKRNREKTFDINSTDREAITVQEDSDNIEASVERSSVSVESDALIETVATSASLDQQNVEDTSNDGSTYLGESKESGWDSITLDENTSSLATSEGLSKVLAGNTLNAEISERRRLETGKSHAESTVSSERHREDALIFGEELSNQVSLLKRDRHFKTEDDREDLLATDINLVHTAERIEDSSEELDLGSELVTTGNAVYTPPRKKAKDISLVANELLKKINADLAENKSSDGEETADDLATDSTIANTRTEENIKKIDRLTRTKNLRPDPSKLASLVSDESYKEEDVSSLKKDVLQELSEAERKHRINKKKATKAIAEAMASALTEVDTTLSNGKEEIDIESSVKASTDQSSSQIHEENPLAVKSESSKELSQERRGHHISSEQNGSAERVASVKVHSTTTSEKANAEATLTSAGTADEDSSASIEIHAENAPSEWYSQVADNASEETEVYHDEKDTAERIAAFSSVETEVLDVIETENKIKDKSRIADHLVTLHDKPRTLKSLSSEEDSRQMEDHLRREEHINSDVSDFASSQSESNLERSTEIMQAFNTETLSESRALVGTELETIAKTESQQAEDVSSEAEVLHQLSQERKGQSISTEEDRKVETIATTQTAADILEEVAEEVDSGSSIIASKTDSFSSTENHQYGRNNNKESNQEYASTLENLELQSLASSSSETMDSEYVEEINEEANMAGKETRQHEIEAVTSSESIQEDMSAWESQLSKKESHETKIHEMQAEMRQTLETLDTVSLVEDAIDDNIIEIGTESLSSLENVNDSSEFYTNAKDTTNKVLNIASASAETETGFKATTKSDGEVYNAGSKVGTIERENEENLSREDHLKEDIAITSEASQALFDEGEMYNFYTGTDSFSSTETATVGHSAEPLAEINKDDDVANKLINTEADSYTFVSTEAHADSEVSTVALELSKELREELQQHASTEEQSVAAFSTASAAADSKLTTDGMYEKTSLETQQEIGDSIRARNKSHEILNNHKLSHEENNREAQSLASSSIEIEYLKAEEMWDEVETKATVKDKSKAFAQRLETLSSLESKKELEEQARDFIIDKKDINVDTSSLASAQAEINGTSSSNEIALVSQELHTGNRAESLISRLSGAVSAEFDQDKSISLISNKASNKKQEDVSIERNGHAEASAIASTKAKTDLVDSAVLSEEVHEATIERNLATGKAQTLTAIESDSRKNVSELSLESFYNQPGRKHCHGFNCNANKEMLRDKLTILADRLNTLQSALSAEKPRKHKAYLIQAKDAEVSTDFMDQIETEGDIRHRAAALARKLTSKSSLKLDAEEQSSMSEEYLEESKEKKQHHLTTKQKLLEGLAATSAAAKTAARVSDTSEKMSDSFHIHRNGLNIAAGFDPIISTREKIRLLLADDIITGISSELDLGSTLVTAGSKVYQATNAGTHQDINVSALKSEILRDILNEKRGHAVTREDSVERMASSSISGKLMLAKLLDASEEASKELDIRNGLTHAEAVASTIVRAEEGMSALKSKFSYGNSREKKEHRISLEKDTELDSREVASAEAHSTSAQSLERSRVTSKGVDLASELTPAAMRQHAIASSKAQLEEDVSSLTTELSQDTSREKVIHHVSTQKDAQLEKSILSDSAEMIASKLESTRASEEISNESSVNTKSAHSTAEAHSISSSQSKQDENMSVLRSESSNEISHKEKNRYASEEEDIELQTVASSLTGADSSVEQSFDTSREINADFDTENNLRDTKIKIHTLISSESDEQESVLNSKASHVISEAEDKHYVSKEEDTQLSSVGIALTEIDREDEILASEHLESEQDKQVQTTLRSSVETDRSHLQFLDTSNENMEHDITGNLQQLEGKTYLSSIEAQKDISNSDSKFSHEILEGNERHRTIENNADAETITSTEVHIGLADSEEIILKMGDASDTESKLMQSGSEAYAVASSEQQEDTSLVESKTSHELLHEERVYNSVNTEVESQGIVSTEADFNLDYSGSTSTEINKQLEEKNKLISSEDRKHAITSTASVEVDTSSIQSADATKEISEDLNVGSATREKVKSQTINSTELEYTDAFNSESSNIALLNHDKRTELDATAIGSTEAHVTSTFLTDAAEEISEDLDTLSQLARTQETDKSFVKSDFPHEMFAERNRHYPNSRADIDLQEIDVVSGGDDTNFIRTGGITQLTSDELDTLGRLTDAEIHRVTSEETQQKNDISDEGTKIYEDIAYGRKEENDVFHSLDGIKEISRELDAERKLFDVARAYAIPKSERAHLEEPSALKLGSYEQRRSQGQSDKVKALASMEVEDFVGSLSAPEEATKKVDIGNQLASAVTETASEIDVHNTHEEDTIEVPTNHLPSLLFHRKYKHPSLPKVSLEDIQSEESGDTLPPIESSRPLYPDNPIDTEDVWDLARDHIRTPNIPTPSIRGTHFSDEISRDIHTTTTVNPQGDTTAALIFQAYESGGSVEDHSLLMDINFVDSSDAVKLKKNSIEEGRELSKSQSSMEDVINATEGTIIDSSLIKAISIASAETDGDSSDVDVERDETVKISDTTRVATLAPSGETHLRNTSVDDTSETDMAASAVSVASSTIDREVDKMYRTSHENLSSISRAPTEGKPSKHLVHAIIEELDSVGEDAALEESIENDYEEHVPSHEEKFFSTEESDSRRIHTKERSKEYEAHISHGKIEDTNELLSHEAEKNIGIEELSVEATSQTKDVHRESQNFDNELLEGGQINTDNALNKLAFEEMEILSSTEDNTSMDVSLSRLTNTNSAHRLKELTDVTREVSDEFEHNFSEAVSDTRTVSTRSREDGISVETGERFGDTKIEAHHRESHDSSDEQLVDKSIWSNGIADMSASADAISHATEESDQTKEITDEQKSHTTGVEIDIDGSASEFTAASKEKLHSLAEEVETSNEEFLDGRRLSEIAAIDIGNARGESSASLDAVAELETSLTEENWSSEGISKERNEIDGSRQIETESRDSINPYPDDRISNKGNGAISPLSTIGGDSNEANKHPTEHSPWFKSIESSTEETPQVNKIVEEELDDDDFLTPPKLALVPTKRGILLLPLTMEASEAADASDAPELGPRSTEPTEAGSGGQGDRSTGHLYPPTLIRPFDYSKTDIYIVRRSRKGPVRITHMNDGVPPLVSFRLIPREVYEQVRNIIGQHRLSYNAYPVGTSPIHL